MVDVVRATREAGSIQVGASPRGSLALLKLGRAKAAVAGRDFVTPEDVKAVAVPALAHRLTLRPELWVQRVRPEDVVAERLETVPTPPAEDLRPGRARMTRAAADRSSAPTAGLCASALLAALVLRRPELAAVAAPFALALGLGLAASERARVGLSLRVEPRAGARGRRRRADAGDLGRDAGRAARPARGAARRA